MAKLLKGPKVLENIPFWMEWIDFDGESCVAQVNYEKSVKTGKLHYDISRCMTKAINQVIEKTVLWNKGKHFKKNNLTTEYNV